ncbi:MAG: hypothetical protein QGH94_01270, partial [Phycisphaerae bacterium]|nr:hypothetical protein [Phycisphaerae bacterium]
MTACKRLKLSHAAAAVAAMMLITAGCAQHPVNPTASPGPKVAIDPHATHAQQVMLDDHARMRDLAA